MEKRDMLKIKQLEILIYFHKFCISNDVKYSLSYGTALGAVRHKGFIPWDDDIDVMMDRNNYNKFKNKYDNGNENYFLQSVETDPNYNLPFSKLRNSNTTFVEKGNLERKMNHGIFIDIFIWDYIPINPLFRNYQKNILRLNWIITRDGSYSNSVNGKLSKLIWQLTKKRRQNILRFCKKEIERTNKLKSIYITETGYGAGLYYDKYMIEKTYFEQYIDIEFEGFMFKIIKNYDLFLNKAYGNYHELPPESERINLHEYEALDYDTPFERYLNYDEH